ncbi:MAG: histidine kinase [Firmicutes bacterium]|nr:histidine kinase [Bacillota bacterium]
MKKNNPKNELSYEAITHALFENYESIYDIDVETSAYQCYYESGVYSRHKIAEGGDDFFASLASYVPRAVHPEDCEYVLKMLDREKMLAALDREKYYSFVYRLLIDGKPIYHKVRATLGKVGDRRHILLGVRDVDETLRQEQAHTEALSSMYQKEKNHMEAILSSAAGYIEINLTKDIVLERSLYYSSVNTAATKKFSTASGQTVYSDLNAWVCENQIVENKERYALISGREYLLNCFEKGEKRASVSFSVVKENGDEQPCKELFHLYQDNVSGDVMAFCVIYDLTEQQRREKEVRDLENALQMSRIRNSTSQMQPHFLYNALGSIQEVLLDDPEYASELLGDFTVHLRSCVRAMANDSPIPFEQEIVNIKSYVNIEKMRFGDKLNIIYDIPVKNFSIVPLSVQPLVENAIRHGIYQRGAKGGSVTVRSGETPEAWIVEVLDDGVGFDISAIKKSVEAGRQDSTGLKNIIFRLDKVMQAKVDINSVPELGTKVTIHIPKGVGA